MSTPLRYPKVITVSVSKETHAAILAECQRTGATQAEVIRRWMARHPFVAAQSPTDVLA